jgi:hypothetical protein
MSRASPSQRRGSRAAMADAPWCAVAARLFAAVSRASEAFAARRTAAGAHSLPGCSSLNWRGLTAPPLSHSYATHHSELKQQIAQV